jgi:hypothetical protein
MKSFVFTTRHEPPLLAHLTGDLLHRGLFPEQFASELLGDGNVQIRLRLSCRPGDLERLQAYWKAQLRIDSVTVTFESPPDLSRPPLEPEEPVAAMD